MPRRICECESPRVWASSPMASAARKRAKRRADKLAAQAGDLDAQSRRAAESARLNRLRLLHGRPTPKNARRAKQPASCAADLAQQVNRSAAKSCVRQPSVHVPITCRLHHRLLLQFVSSSTLPAIPSTAMAAAGQMASRRQKWIH